MTVEALRAVLPGYEIGEELGRGGFGIVYAGVHRQLGRPVAVKQLPPAMAADSMVRSRFVAEARVLASFEHPHIVLIYDYVEEGGTCALVMERLTGGTAWEHFAERGFTMETTAALTMAACDGLHYAHQRGVLHRDMKPENLIFAGEGSVKVTDFGIARVVGGADMLATHAGEILGTPAYIAPEQAEGGDLGPPADVYATGVMLYELLSGQLPFSDEGGPLAVVYRHMYEDPVPIEEVTPAVPEALGAVAMRALARQPDDRWPTAEAMGVAVGEAATSLWGPGWLGRAQVSLMAPGPILASAQATGAAPTATPPAAVGTGPAPPPVDDGRETVSRVRPMGSRRRAGRAGPDDPGELLPVREVVRRPPAPLLPAVVALGLLAAILLFAFVGFGSPDRAAGFPPGAVTVAGVDVASGGPVPVDFEQPIEVRVLRLPAAAAGANQAVMAFSAAGVPLIESGTRPLTPDGGGAVALLEAKGNRFLAAGQITAELRLGAGEQAMLRHEFAVEPAQSPFLTVPGALGAAAVLFLVAYAESLLRPLRQGRRQTTRWLGILVVGAALGPAAVFLAWLLGSDEPVPASLVTAGLGILAGLAAGMAAGRAGRRRRARRRQAGAETAAEAA